MNIQKHFLFLMTISMLIVMGACNPIDKSKVEIIINTPANLQEFNQSDTVFIKGSITSDVDLTGYKLNLANTLDGSSFLQFTVNGNFRSFNFDTFYVNKVTTNVDASIRIDALKASGSNNKASIVYIKLKP